VNSLSPEVCANRGTNDDQHYTKDRMHACAPV
jgi:hypothetical protein